MFNRKLKSRIANLEDAIESERKNSKRWYDRCVELERNLKQCVENNKKNCQTALEKNEENRELRFAHASLVLAHANIIESATEKPNGTVRRLIAISEDALINDPISDVKPERRFSREAS